jgi:L-threonylcarbamoyladenylate synthase
MAIIGKDSNEAARWLNKGEVVAIPTETVYGLAALIFKPEAISKVYSVKGRPVTNPLIVHVHSVEMVKALTTEFPPVAEILAKAFWPGPLTMILPKQPTVADTITAGQPAIAIRIPNHPLTLQLLSELKMPVAAPSANPFNYISPVTAQQVNQMLGEKIPYILDGGRCHKGIESTIVAYEDNQVKILRPGAISAEEIEKVLQQKVVQKNETAIAHPGMFKQHYSPVTPMVLTEVITPSLLQQYKGRVALLLLDKFSPLLSTEKQYLLSPSGNLDEAAWNLYDFLHQLDTGEYDLIIAQKMPEMGLGIAINDRLAKAAHLKG